jgi:hypothetical protein
MDEPLDRLVRSTLRSVGRQYEEAKRAYREGRREADLDLDLPRDDSGRVRLVCRLHAERRAVDVDGAGHPACFDPDHPDCRGCVEDVREGVVETW